MRLVTNPVLIRALTVFVCSAFFFLLGIFFIRALRKNITEEGEVDKTPTGSDEPRPIDLYHTVIQELKQQKHALLVQSQAEQQRARISDNFSQAVLSNLSSGVLVFGANGLVKSVNPAARTILGFASMNGMSAEDIFRAATVRTSDPSIGQEVAIAEEIHAVLHEGSKRRQIDAEYETPKGDMRYLSVTVSPIPSADGTLLGVACLINDLSELDRARKQQELRGELSAEMALQLRSSLTTIAGYAQQLAANRDPEMAKQLAVDIAQEAAQLDRTIGGFLIEKPAAPAKAKGAAAGR